MNCERTKVFSERTMTSTHRAKNTSGPTRAMSRRGKTIPARPKASARRTKEISERRKESSALRRNGLCRNHGSSATEGCLSYTAPRRPDRPASGGRSDVPNDAPSVTHRLGAVRYGVRELDFAAHARAIRRSRRSDVTGSHHVERPCDRDE